ncbi:single-stranded DNA-binding protein [Helicobacter didelphidarum]|uniref:Single-stranded DNA-binding protein n=1 Tax=Helicobacter didelphidarum TaxID=2040648 RepID=A0A3D8IEI1_9HELI|nr:single-stranded DNA-binding protein [Helicobacter didelphidarum]RDU63579.1 single-stranded DNA-binding protein [Helicobacter didelphidarum]
MFNKVIMVGNLTRDVELRHLNTGVALATIGLASNRKYKRQDGTQIDDTCFVDVTLFGRTAEIANQYLKKGSKVLIEGRLNYETWSDQQGNKRSKHTIIAEGLQMLDSRSQGDYSHQDMSNSQGYGNYNASQTSYNQNNYSQNSTGYNNQRNSYQEPPEIDINQDEIPF